MTFGQLSFEEARAIAAAVLGPRWHGRGTFQVASWGHGDEDAWHVVAGPKESDHDPTFVIHGAPVHLVDRHTGELTQHHYFDVRERIARMTPVGDPPPDD